MELDNLEKKLPEKIKTVWRQTEELLFLFFYFVRLLRRLFCIIQELQCGGVRSVLD